MFESDYKSNIRSCQEKIEQIFDYFFNALDRSVKMG